MTEGACALAISVCHICISSISKGTKGPPPSDHVLVQGVGETPHSALSQASCLSPDDQRGGGVAYRGGGCPCWCNNV
jgi:hypothetical protein